MSSYTPMENVVIFPATTTMERSKVNRINKYCLFITNFIFLVAGLCLTSLGSWVLVEKQKRVYDAVDFFFDPASVMSLVGGVVALVALVGCWGSLRENICCLKTYNAVLVFLLFGEIVLVILVFIFYYVPEARKTLRLFPEDTFRHAIVQYTEEEDLKDFIDGMQQTMRCCGLANSEKGFLDWNHNAEFSCYSNSTGSQKCFVPYSCCRTNPVGDYKAVCSPGEAVNYLCGRAALSTQDYAELQDRIYTRGCLKSLGKWINEHAMIIGGASVGIILPQIFIIGLSNCLVMQIRAQMARW